MVITYEDTLVITLDIANVTLQRLLVANRKLREYNILVDFESHGN